jgi:hypothetical protein
MSEPLDPDQAVTPTGALGLALLRRRLVVTLTVSIAVVAMMSASQVDAAASLSAGTTTLSPGGSTTVDASFTGIAPNELSSISIVVTGGTTGTLAISSPTNRTGGIGAACIVGPDSGPPPTPAGEVACLWNGPETAGSLRVPLTASADATGVFQVAAIETRGQARTTVATLSITVPAPSTTAAPTTSAPTTTAAGSGGVASTTAAPTTTASPGALPATGPSRALRAGLIGAVLVTVGAAAVMLTRRGTGSAST